MYSIFLIKDRSQKHDKDLLKVPRRKFMTIYLIDNLIDMHVMRQEVNLQQELSRYDLLRLKKLLRYFFSEISTTKKVL